MDRLIDKKIIKEDPYKALDLLCGLLKEAIHNIEMKKLHIASDLLAEAKESMRLIIIELNDAFSG